MGWEELARWLSQRPATGTAARMDQASSAERRLVTLWQEVLDRRVTLLDDDFFVLGGHSLRIIRLLNRIEQEYSTRVGVRDF
ncbi:phosphopantetheine-binding protein [Streptomyces lydicus]|nr:phosphopantetheine-binding protein [Streptomyces lydicus]